MNTEVNDLIMWLACKEQEETDDCVCVGGEF